MSLRVTKTINGERDMSPRAEKDFVLKYAMNRWQLNFRRNVGSISDSIRECKPNSIDEWRDYYYANVRAKHHIDSLGRKLYVRITEDLSREVRFHPDLLASISEADCIKYLNSVVIDKTYNGYCNKLIERAISVAGQFRSGGDDGATQHDLHLQEAYRR